MRAWWLVFMLPAAYGQPVVGPEIASAPFQSHFVSAAVTPQPVAIASVNREFAIAWCIDNAAGLRRVNVARLDANAYLIPVTMHELPSTEPGADIGDPAITETPAGYAVAWVESQMGSPPRAELALLDRNLNVVKGPKVIRQIGGRIDVKVFNGEMVLVTGSVMSQLDGDLNIVNSVVLGAPVDDVAIAGDQLLFVAHTSTHDEHPCFNFGRGPCPGTVVFDNYDLFIVILYRASFTRHFYFFSSYAPAIASNGKDSLVAWFEGTPREGGTLFAAHLDSQGLGPRLTLGQFGPDPGSAEKPGIAWDGQRYLVVWQDKAWYGNHEIRGAVVDSVGVTQFTVTDTVAEEEHPTVTAVGPGRFLVGYSTTTAGQRRIAGRFIDFPEPRRRVAR
jgi:hypothetical protein